MNVPNLLCLLFLCFTLSVSFSVSESGCPYPLVIQYIASGTIPANDLQGLIQNQIKQPFHLKPINNTHESTVFNSIQMSLMYSGSERQIQNISDREVRVVNDSFNCQVKFNASISKLIGKNSYNVTINSKDVLMTFNKKFNEVDGQFNITQISISYQDNWLDKVVITPEPKNSDQKTKIISVVQNQLNTQMRTQIQSIKTWLSEYSSHSTISNIYPEGIYNYDFYDYEMKIDMGTLSISSQHFNQSLVLVNNMKGQIKGSSNPECPTSIKQTRDDTDSQFITIQFIKNLVSTQNIVGYEKWQNLNINKNWMRTRIFQWRFVDLQFVFPGIVTQYQQYYMNNIYFVCKIIKNNEISINTDRQRIDAIITWNCEGFVEKSQNLQQSLSFINVTMDVKHHVQLWITSQNRLSAYANQIQLIKIQAMGDEPIQTNEYVANVYFEDMYNDFRTYVFGTYFRVQKSESQIILDSSENAQGIWIQ